jgi:putative transposase
MAKADGVPTVSKQQCIVAVTGGTGSCGIRWYFRFRLSLRDIEDLLFERGVIVSYKTARRWCGKFGAGFSHRVKITRRKRGTTSHLDGLFATLHGAKS